MTREIDLVNQNTSYIKYRKHNFPDGQQGITIDENTVHHPGDSYTIKSRFNSFLDLEPILCATAALRGLTHDEIDISLTVPYFLGARSDRKFGFGSYHYLKEVLAPIINAKEYRAVISRDPHSDVVEAVIDRFSTMANTDFINWALKDIGYFVDPENFTFISPDAGAFKKVGDIALNLQHGGGLITATKRRDIRTGKIIRTEVPGLEDGPGPFIIMDDIIDGGRTFLEIANVILEKDPESEIYLVVTHGIFSAGYDELSKKFKRIYVTNSVQDFGDDGFIKSFNTF